MGLFEKFFGNRTHVESATSRSASERPKQPAKEDSGDPEMNEFFRHLERRGIDTRPKIIGIDGQKTSDTTPVSKKKSTGW